MDSGPTPNAKPNAKPAATPRPGGMGAGVSPAPARRYPKPPALLPRFIMLCLRPESWAEAARYPTYVTLIPLFLAALLAAILMSSNDASHLFHDLQAFAASYDSHPYPPLQLTRDGTLSSSAPLEEPIRFQLYFPPLQSLPVLIDPTGKTSPESFKSPAFFITSKELIFLTDEGPAYRKSLASLLSGMALPDELPAAGETKTIDGKSITRFLNTHSSEFVAYGIGLAFSMLLMDAFWIALMMFLLCPIIMLATAGPRLNPDAPDRRLLIPKRAAYRMAAALLVPLILLDAVLHISGHPVANLLGPQGSLLFWFFAAGALAIWTGFIARRLYAPKVSRRA